MKDDLTKAVKRKDKKCEKLENFSTLLQLIAGSLTAASVGTGFTIVGIPLAAAAAALGSASSISATVSLILNKIKRKKTKKLKKNVRRDKCY